MAWQTEISKTLRNLMEKLLLFGWKEASGTRSVKVGLWWQKRTDHSVLLALPEWLLKKVSAGMKDNYISEEIAKVFCAPVRRTKSPCRFFRLILCHSVGAWSPWWVAKIKDKKKKIIVKRINLKIEFKLNFLKQSVIIRFGCFINSVMQPS